MNETQEYDQLQNLKLFIENNIRYYNSGWHDLTYIIVNENIFNNGIYKNLKPILESLKRIQLNDVIKEEQKKLYTESFLSLSLVRKEGHDYLIYFNLDTILHHRIIAYYNESIENYLNLLERGFTKYDYFENETSEIYINDLEIINAAIKDHENLIIAQNLIFKEFKNCIKKVGSNPFTQSKVLKINKNEILEKVEQSKNCYNWSFFKS